MSIFKEYNLVHKKGSFSSMSFCEFPGSWLVALNHWILNQVNNYNWNWTAQSLIDIDPEHGILQDDYGFLKKNIQITGI